MLGRRRPAVSFFHQPPRRPPELTTPGAVAQKSQDAIGEFVRLVGEHDVLAIGDRQPLRTNRRRDDRLSGGHGWKILSRVPLPPEGALRRQRLDGGTDGCRPRCR